MNLVYGLLHGAHFLFLIHGKHTLCTHVFEYLKVLYWSLLKIITDEVLIFFSVGIRNSYD